MQPKKMCNSMYRNSHMSWIIRIRCKEKYQTQRVLQNAVQSGSSSRQRTSTKGSARLSSLSPSTRAPISLGLAGSTATRTMGAACRQDADH